MMGIQDKIGILKGCHEISKVSQLTIKNIRKTLAGGLHWKD